MPHAPPGRDRRVGIIGAGRLGSSLGVALCDAGYSVTAVSRRDLAQAEATSAGIEGSLGTDDVQTVADACDVVFITTSDSAIGSVLDSLSIRPGQAVVHCSGATPVSMLTSAEEQGASTGGFHPLQTFPRPLEAGRFRAITVGVASENDGLLEWLETLADDVGATSMRVPDEARAAYHAAATLASPLTAGLAGLAATLWTDLGVSRDEALQALAPLLTSTVADLGSMSFPDGITGPYVRGDVGVVRAHLDAVRSAPADVSRAYAALALAALPDSAVAGGLASSKRDEIEQLLRAHLEERS